MRQRLSWNIYIYTNITVRAHKTRKNSKEPGNLRNYCNFRWIRSRCAGAAGRTEPTVPGPLGATSSRRRGRWARRTRCAGAAWRSGATWRLEIAAQARPRALRSHLAPQKHCAGATGRSKSQRPGHQALRTRCAGAAGRSKSQRRCRWALEITAPGPPGAPNSLRRWSCGSVPWLGPAWRLESKTSHPL